MSEPRIVTPEEAQDGQARYALLLVGHLTQAMHDERRPGPSDCWSCEASQSTALRDFAERMVADQSTLADEAEHLAHTVATEPDRTRAAVVKALTHLAQNDRDNGRSAWLIGKADAIENGADW